MTKQKSTKRALLMSGLALLMCVSMLIGSTFAWFTDSVTSGNNNIQSGNLDIELWHCVPADTTYGFGFDETNGEQITGDTALFMNVDGDPILWEPGVEAAEAFRIKNVGSLALKYQFRIKAIDATKTPEGKDLTDVITMQIIELENDELGVPVGAGLEYEALFGEGYVIEGELLAGESTDFNVCLDWYPSENDNDFNVPGGLKLTYAVDLIATQLTYEKDSYGDQYDKDATYPEIWDGEVGTVPDAVDNTVTISTPAELAAFAATVNGGNSYSGKTVVLANDINLGNQTWTPIGDCESGEYFQGTFDGQGNTIYNLHVDKSTDGSQYSTAGLFGWVDAAMATVKNVNVDGATVLGSHWVGAIAGYWTGTIDNCSVNNATVVAYNVNDNANGDKVGGIVGYLNDDSNINNNTVTNSTITGNRDIGGIVGAVAETIDSMSNNKVSDTVITYTTEKDYASAGAIVSGRTDYNPDETNIATNVSIFKAVSDGLSTDADGNFYVYTAEGLQSLKNWMDANSNKSSVWGKEYNIMANIDATNVNWTTKFMVPDSATFDGFTFNGNGYTISNLIINGQGLFTGTAKGSQSTVPATFKNITFDNVTVTGGSHHNGVVWGEAYGSVTLEKVNVINSKVSGGCNVGGLVGRNSESHATFKFIDCAVKNTTIEATKVADYAGASAFLGMALHIDSSCSANVIFEGNNVSEGNTLTTAEGMQGGGIYTTATWGAATWETPTVVDTFTNYNSAN